MKDDPDKALWQLLGKAGSPSVSPFFSRNVLREVRNLRTAKPRHAWKSWLISSTGFAALLAGALLFPFGAPVSAHHATTDDFETIAQFDQLMATEMNDAWAEVTLF